MRSCQGTDQVLEVGHAVLEVFDFDELILGVGLVDAAGADADGGEASGVEVGGV